MSSIFNEDFLEYIDLLNKYQVEYLLIGGLAVNLHGYRRSTGDMDIWVKPTQENHDKLTHVHAAYRMPMGEMELIDNFLDTEKYDVFRFGGGFFHIDIMTVCKGLDFDNTYKNSIETEVEKIRIKLIHVNSLIRAKKASARYKDLDDIEKLNKIKKKVD